MERGGLCINWMRDRLVLLLNTVMYQFSIISVTAINSYALIFEVLLTEYPLLIYAATALV